jgi:hypothetical protein
MNSYLEATATDVPLTVVVTTQSGVTTTTYPLTAAFKLTSTEPILKLEVDGINCSDYVYQQTLIDSPLPFYLWYHQITGQGWLFT